MKSLPAFLLTLLLGASSFAQIGPDYSQGWDKKHAPEAAKALGEKIPAFIKQQVQMLVRDADDSTALLYRFAAKAEGGSTFPPDDQESLGSCVGFAGAHAASISYACDIYHRREREVWKARASGAGCYVLSRQHANRLGSWEGSTGAWLCSALQEVGVPWKLSFTDADLTTYDVRITRGWQSSGLPRSVIESAKNYPVISCHLVKSAKELKAGIQNGYAAITCSSVSWAGKRDAMGFAVSDGNNWQHATCICGYRGPDTGAEGYLDINSWNPRWINGPLWPEDQPPSSFWIKPRDMQRAIAEGDTWLIGGVTGFPKKELTWVEALEVGGK